MVKIGWTILACPMCKDLLERGKDALQMMRFGEGIAWSILLMLSMPFLLIASIAFLIYRSSRQAKNRPLARAGRPAVKS